MLSLAACLAVDVLQPQTGGILAQVDCNERDLFRAGFIHAVIVLASGRQERKELDEKVATLHFQALGAALSVLAQEQADRPASQLRAPSRSQVEVQAPPARITKKSTTLR